MVKAKLILRPSGLEPELGGLYIGQLVRVNFLGIRVDPYSMQLTLSLVLISDAF